MMREDILYYNQALDYTKEGHWSMAKPLLLKAIALNPGEAEYYSLLGVVHLGLDERALAIQQFRIACAINAKDPLLQSFMPLLILGDKDSDMPPDIKSPVPRKPYPSSPSTELEALPDHGISNIP